MCSTHKKGGEGVEGYMQMCEDSNKAQRCLQEDVRCDSRKGAGANVLQEEVLKAVAIGTVRCKKNQWARGDRVTEQLQWQKE